MNACLACGRNGSGGPCGYPSVDPIPDGCSRKHGIVWERLSQTEMRSIRFLDRPLLQASAFHLVAGRKGQGKGTVLSDIAARVNRGELGEKRNVVWIGSEDSAAIDIGRGSTQRAATRNGS
jgi:hypothetical protein